MKKNIIFSLYPVDFQMKYIHTDDLVNFKGNHYQVGKIDTTNYTIELWTGDNDVLTLYKTIDYPSNSHSLMLLSKTKSAKSSKKKQKKKLTVFHHYFYRILICNAFIDLFCLFFSKFTFNIINYNL